MDHTLDLASQARQIEISEQQKKVMTICIHPLYQNPEQSLVPIKQDFNLLLNLCKCGLPSITGDRSYLQELVSLVYR